MNASDLKDLRTRAKLSQADMADLMGLAPRSYQDLERGETPLSLRHRLAAERASLRLAVFNREIGLALPAVRKDALDYAALVRGEAEGAESLPELMIKYAEVSQRLASRHGAQDENPAEVRALQADLAQLNTQIAAEKRRQGI